MSTILSIDPSGSPNGHTGIALVHYSDTEPATLLASWAVRGGLEPFRKWFMSYAWGENEPGDAINIQEFSDDYTELDTVIVEHFVNRNIAGADISPLGMEYVVQWLWPDAVLSPASGKNTAVSDVVLKRLDMYDDKSHHHDVREASRHAIWWLKKQGHKPTLLKGYPR